MTAVTLTGQLICADDIQARLVERLLPRHIELTRGEVGCTYFDVVRVGTSLTWQVEQRFEAAYAAHQQRVASSDRGRATTEIERRYLVARVGGGA